MVAFGNAPLTLFTAVFLVAVVVVLVISWRKGE